MIKIKPIIICASTAFVLSFFTALIAKTGFPISLLKAVIFAVVFGGIAVGVQVVYDKFLSEGDSSAMDIAPQQQKTVGGKVDLVVSEEDLPGDKDMPAFALDSTRHVLTANDVGFKVDSMRAPKSPPPQPAEPVAAPPQPSEEPSEPSQEAAPEPEEPEGAGGFVPTSLAAPESSPATKPAAPKPAPVAESAPAAATPSAEAAAPAPAQAAPAVQSAPAAQNESGLESLPELDEMPNLGGDDSGGGVKDENLVEDSDFAEEGSVRPSRQTEFPDGKVADSKDAELMAKAIQTVLKKEE